VVIALKPGGQAERLEIEVGDRLVAVHGNELPPPDESEAKRAKQLDQKALTGHLVWECS